VTGEQKTLRVVEAEPEAEDEYRLEEQVGFLLRKANQRHLAIFASQIGDLTTPQFAALAKLYQAGPTSQNRLGSLIAMDAATVKGVIDRLCARELVELSRHKGDRRRLMVSLTDAGRELFERVLPLAKTITAQTLSPLTEREAATLARLLSKIG
jgi:DNA-binding MarR family transcriptional regulator